MKKFFEISKPSIIIACIASILFCIDCILAKYLWSRYDAAMARGFMWVAFVAWTISFGMKTDDKIRLWIGNFFGFLAGTGMIYFGKIFGANIWGIGIASLFGVFLFNAAVMYFNNFKKFYLDSVTGIFMGIFLVFSGLGVGIGVDTFANAGILLGIIAVYSMLGLLCAFFSVYFINFRTKKFE